MTPRRFLFAIRPYAPDQGGGSARSTQNLAEALLARGHEVHVVRLVPKDGVADARAAAAAAGLLAPDRPTLHFHPIHNIYGPYDDTVHHGALQKAVWHAIDLHNPAAARDFRALVRAVRPDVVNTSVVDGFSTSIFAAATAEGAKLVHTMRDYYLLCSRSGMFRGGKPCERLCGDCTVHAAVRRRHARHVDLFLANSRFVADEHARYGAFPAGRPVLVQWNINDNPLVNTPRALPDDRIVFGFIGRIAPTKGVENLLDAAIMQRDAGGRDWSLDIAGDGDPAYLAQLRTRYGDDRIRFVGWTKAAPFYDSIDVLICPSTYNEPLPRVIYEGYGFALPTIAAASGGIPEVVEDGVTGLLYRPDDVATFASHMARFRAMPTDEYRRFSAAALAAATPFTADAVISTYEARIDALLSGGLPE
ncbi:glycosyltransferase family 4 protein [Sphingomonas yunnanensis]|uniref:glycosyltransferase family 4 protein n=1 Tax=Sphingomonas yunnanensis TaxID=310400 RepID=UPI001CA79E4E|nr:glycosyltransferase family 4 protein [Sphingomonas yunnanensis]MBY9064151.1 glycosyltransferase family 4 protein [Sphingomonas yunnanensis]